MWKEKNNPETGEAVDRVDGFAKVTGSAKYAAEYALPSLTYGVLVTSTIAKGTIKNINTKSAENAPGVKAVVTHLNKPEVPGYNEKTADPRVAGQAFRVFYDDKVLFYNQPVAIVVADTFERAHYAASLVKVEYSEEKHETDITANLDKAVKPKNAQDYKRGDEDAYKNSEVKIEQEYETPFQVHNPMEPHAVTVWWQDEKHVIIYNKTQAVKIAQSDIMKAFALKEDNVHVISKFAGGAFGSASRIWPGEMAAIIAAKKTGNPVKVALERYQLFNMVGYRPTSMQKVSIGASADGMLKAITHEAYGSTSMYEQFPERITDPVKTTYNCPNITATYRLVPLDMSTPCWTRGPGESSGAFALESAMDELSYQLKMDPLQLRFKNYAEKDPEKNLPWSSKYLKECYEQGAEKFGWSKRNPASRSMRKGDVLVGMGMSTGVYGANRSEATARVIFKQDGSLTVQSATADVGPGTATVMSQIGADASGVAIEKIKFELGDSSLPPAPGQFGSHTVASVGSAVHDVCTALKENILKLAGEKDGSPFKDAKADDVNVEKGLIKLVKDPSVHISYTEILKQHNMPLIEIVKESKGGPELKQYSSKAFCANFVEVEVNALTGMIKVSRVVSAVDCGKIMNKKTAESQVYGSVVWGIGMALMEDGIIDHRYGNFINNNLADYHLPVNADVPNIDVLLIDKQDPILNPMGAKGMGEIALVGFAAAVANAVYHATGVRVRRLPVTADKLV